MTDTHPSFFSLNFFFFPSGVGCNTKYCHNCRCLVLSYAQHYAKGKKCVTNGEKKEGGKIEGGKKEGGKKEGGKKGGKREERRRKEDGKKEGGKKGGKKIERNT